MEVDARLLGRPPRFTGNEAEWSDWSFQARAYFDTVNPSMADHLDAEETNSDRVITLSSLGDVAVENARKMFYALTMLLQGQPLLLLKKVESRQRVRSLETAGAIRRNECESTASYAAVRHAPEDVHHKTLEDSR